MKKIFIGLAGLCLCSSFVCLNNNESLAVKAVEEISITFEKRVDGDWNNKVWNIPENFVHDGNADLTQASALQFEVDNSLGEAFTWNIGIFDKTRSSNPNDEWLSNGKGSALYLPEHGDIFYEDCSKIPAGFKGKVVLPLTTYIHKGNTLTSPRYTTPNNPVFGIRDSIDGNHGLYSVSDKTNLQTFPTSTMDTKFTFYVHDNWTNAAGIDETFSNIQLINASQYQDVLSCFQNLDFHEIGIKNNEISLENSIIFKDSNSGKTLKYQCNSYGNKTGVTTNAISVENAVALAFRVKNFNSSDTKVDLKINETSGSLVFGLANEKVTKCHYISVDGTETTLDNRGAMVIPARFDGSIIVPLQNLGTYTMEGTYDTHANGRLNGGIWTIEFYTYVSNNFFTFAGIQAIQSSYDSTLEKNVYTSTIVGAKKQADNSLYAHAKNKDCWSGYSLIDNIGKTSKIKIEEYFNGSKLDENHSTLFAENIYKYDISTLTLGVGGGRLLKKLTVDNVDVTDEIRNEEGIFKYDIVGMYNDGHDIDVKIEYSEGFNITYVYNGGLPSIESNPTFYTSENVGSNALELHSPIWANHVFMGWYNRVEFSHNDAFVIEKIDYDFLGLKGYNHDDITLYARWGDEYNLNIIDKENNKQSSFLIKLGEALNKEDSDSVLTKEGYSYKLYSDQYCTKEITLPFFGRDLNVDIYVKYTPNRYTIRFQSLGGSMISSVTRTYGSDLGFLLEPTYEGHVFMGWYYSDDFDVKASNTDKITEDTYLYAKWGLPGVESQKDTIKMMVIIDICAGAVLLGGAATFVLTKVVKIGKKKNEK